MAIDIRGSGEKQTILVQFHLLGARRKLQKARPFESFVKTYLYSKTTQNFEVYPLCRVGEIEP